MPRQAWPGGKIVTSNKNEALIKYHRRKGLPLPDHLQALVDEEEERRTKRAKKFGCSSSVGASGSSPGAMARRRGGLPGAPKGGVKVLSGVEGAVCKE